MYQKIPFDLKTEKAWVNVWNGSKIPMQSTQRKAASASCPETWSTFEDALAAYNYNLYDGIGYVFHDTGLVGIDIDAGFDDDGFLSELGADIISKCQSYTEVSRSGRGFHILLRGDLPFLGRNNRKGVEIYKSNRYFILTGKTMFYQDIVENQEAIDYVVKTYFADILREGKSDVIQRIYSPIWTKPAEGKVPLRPEYPQIIPGGRNISLASLAGQMHNTGYNSQAIYDELSYANQVACNPPLPQDEVELIVKSISKYQR